MSVSTLIGMGMCLADVRPTRRVEDRRRLAWALAATPSDAY
jgi:hypothetical protein